MTMMVVGRGLVQPLVSSNSVLNRKLVILLPLDKRLSGLLEACALGGWLAGGFAWLLHLSLSLSSESLWNSISAWLYSKALC